jgi:hypothetical protein
MFNIATIKYVYRNCIVWWKPLLPLPKTVASYGRSEPNLRKNP